MSDYTPEQVEALAVVLYRHENADELPSFWPQECEDWFDLARAAITALDLPGIIRAAKVEAINDAVMLLDGNDPGWPRDPYSPMSCLEDHMTELIATTIENGANDAR